MHFTLQKALHTFYLYCNTIYAYIVERGDYMAFQIRPNKKESENKTIRFPLELINQINQAIEGNDVSFSNFVIQACQYALDNMETDAE